MEAGGITKLLDSDAYTSYTRSLSSSLADAINTRKNHKQYFVGFTNARVGREGMLITTSYAYYTLYEHLVTTARIAALENATF